MALGYGVHLVNQAAVAYDDGTTPGSTFRFNVGGGAPVLAAQQRHDEFGYLRQLALTPADDVDPFATAAASKVWVGLPSSSIT